MIGRAIGGQAECAGGPALSFGHEAARAGLLRGVPVLGLGGQRGPLERPPARHDGPRAVLGRRPVPLGRSSARRRDGLLLALRSPRGEVLSQLHVRSSHPSVLLVSPKRILVHGSLKVQRVTGVGRDRHLSVTLNAPSGLLLSTVDDARGQVDLDARETGFYQMCFSNFHNRFGSMQVALSFGVYYEKQQPQDAAARKLNDTLAVIEASARRLENAVFHMFRHYNYGRVRRGADDFLLTSDRRRVGCCSAALAVLVVLAGYLQLRFLQSLFGHDGDAELRA
ncbi:transmembrane emp24 domain-containing protein 6 isoform X1 [Phyllopteryx taeniolatus]|uniref:transmembrane emp24 domain-containing protein 6 isoform X1 n=1 Tax=Phyllopteryx taeniolatus TaxID=161469 RepID=UPI002AD224D0|nr:transmembrane emp24 domain-containing protein 6 isoform X1 [Phyllopteryx taeniolatus]